MFLLRILGIAILSFHLHLLSDEDAATSTNTPPELSIATLFEEDLFAAKDFAAEWAEDSSGYLRTIDSLETRGGTDIVLIDPTTGSTNVLVAAQDLIPPGRESPLGIHAYSFSKSRSHVLIFTNSQRVWRYFDRGDYWVLDRTSLELRQVAANAPPASLSHAKFSPNGRFVAYVRDRNLFVEELRTGHCRQLTSTDAADIFNGSFDWVYEEEFEMRDGWRWSPDSQSILFWQIDSSAVRKFPLIDFVSGLYPQIQWIPYPKAGEQNPAARAGIVNLDSGNITWLQIPGDPRDHYLRSLEWPPHAPGIIVQQLNRLQNTLQFFIVDPKSGEPRLLFTETDAAWVDLRAENPWAGDGQLFPWLSERDCWKRPYSVNTDTGAAQPLFDAPMDAVSIVQFVPASGDLFFIASPENATQRYLFHTSIHGAAPKRLTPDDHPGTHHYQISPDGKWAIHSHSTFNQPPVVQLLSLPDHRVVRTLESNQDLKDKLDALAWPPAEFFQVPVSPDLQVDAYCIKPPNFDPQHRYPVIVYVYGEPAGQTVRDQWPSSNGLWHRLLANHGCVVFSFDNRGTPAPRGRDWRKSIYRQVGILAPADQAAALRHTLESRPYLDPSRVGIWGWSGGGSMSLNAILKYPDLYHAAIAVAPVPNMRLYDTIYQERYMGLPDDNVEGYRDGSPLHFAHQLTGQLLLIHGTGDDNVHYQGMEALIDRLIHHQKQFELLIYPNRSHGIGEGQNTTLHLREAMLRFWHRHLLNANPPATNPKEP